MNELASRPSLLDCLPGGLVSLWDIMQSVDIGKLIELERLQERVQQIFRLEASNRSSVPLNAMMRLSDPPKEVGRDLAKDIIEQIDHIADEFGLRVTKKSTQRAKASPPATDRELGVVYNVMIDELDGFNFFWIDASKANFWKNDALLSASALKSFGGPVADEIKSAGAAYACGLDTASVFHSMRAAETGLRIVAGALSVTITGDEHLKVVIDGIEAKAKSLDTVPKHPNKISDSQFYCEVAIDAGLMKDAWRNHVAHAKSTYDSEKAKQILDATCRFFEKLSERFTQHSTP